MIAATTEAGGSAPWRRARSASSCGRIIPVTTPTGEEGYQPSRMWVVEGPRWLLRGIVYGQAALEEDLDPPVARVPRRVPPGRGPPRRPGHGPGDLLPLTLPEDLARPMTNAPSTGGMPTAESERGARSGIGLSSLVPD